MTPIPFGDFSLLLPFFSNLAVLQTPFNPFFLACDPKLLSLGFSKLTR